MLPLLPLFIFIANANRVALIESNKNMNPKPLDLSCGPDFLLSIYVYVPILSMYTCVLEQFQLRLQAERGSKYFNLKPGPILFLFYEACRLVAVDLPKC